MIKLPNNCYTLGLEDQVRKNKEDIARHYEIDRTLANFGIKIVGQVESTELLPDPSTYAGEYGDGYAVGVSAEVEAGNASYDFYIFTRPNADTPYDHWLDVGKLGIRGPQGESIVGPAGPAGTASTWYSGAAIPSSDFNYTEGDMYLQTGDDAGKVYRYNGTMWEYLINITGQAGESIVGPPGPAGGIRILGVVDQTNHLPSASSAYSGKGFLVGTTAPYLLYGCIPDGTNYVWINMGTYTGGTIITDANNNAISQIALSALASPQLYNHTINTVFEFDSGGYTEKVTIYREVINADSTAYNYSSKNAGLAGMAPALTDDGRWHPANGTYRTEGSYGYIYTIIKAIKISGNNLLISYNYADFDNYYMNESTITISPTQLYSLITYDTPTPI